MAALSSRTALAGPVTIAAAARLRPSSCPPTPSTAPRRQAQGAGAPAGGDKKLMARKVLGTVQWFHVRNGYGFISRNDAKEGALAHATAVKKNKPRKHLRVSETGRRWSVMMLAEVRVGQ